MQCKGCKKYDPDAPFLFECEDRVSVRNGHSYTDICDYFRALDP